jgi:two-component system OmpR family response regulator
VKLRDTESSQWQRICVVEDDVRVRRLLRAIFEGAGFAVSEASSESDLKRVMKRHSVALVTLDLSLRDEDGIALARNIQVMSDVPIVMITARADDVDRIVGLEIGADDYIVKPFNNREVIARVRAVLRRSNGRRGFTCKEADAFRFGDWVLDCVGHELRTVSGEVCALTTAEFRLLEALLRYAGRVLSRDCLIDLVGGIDAEPLQRSIDTTISRLRRKIEVNSGTPRFIKTIRGVGCCFSGKIES